MAEREISLVDKQDMLFFVKFTQILGNLKSEMSLNGNKVLTYQNQMVTNTNLFSSFHNRNTLYSGLLKNKVMVFLRKYSLFGIQKDIDLLMQERVEIALELMKNFKKPIDDMALVVMNTEPKINEAITQLANLEALTEDTAFVKQEMIDCLNKSSSLMKNSFMYMLYLFEELDKAVAEVIIKFEKIIESKNINEMDKLDDDLRTIKSKLQELKNRSQGLEEGSKEITEKIAELDTIYKAKLSPVLIKYGLESLLDDLMA